jgi:DNA-binding NtrC family response regulator
VEDIPLLAEHFNYSFMLKTGREYAPIAEEHLEHMMSLPWRGNVRELAACVKKYATSGEPEMLFGESGSGAGKRSDESVMPSSLVAPRPPERIETPAPNNDAGMGQLGSGQIARPAPPEPAPPPPSAPTAATTPKRGTREFPSLKEASRKAVEETERALIEEALQYTLWNRRKAAKLLKISYSSLLRRIDAYNIGE